MWTQGIASALAYVSTWWIISLRTGNVCLCAFRLYGKHMLTIYVGHKYVVSMQVCAGRGVCLCVCGCMHISRLMTPRKVVPEPWTTLPNVYNMLDLPPTYFQRPIWRCSSEYWPPALFCPSGTLVPNYSLDQAQRVWGSRHFLVHIGFSQTLVWRQRCPNLMEMVKIKKIKQ